MYHQNACVVYIIIYNTHMGPCMYKCHDVTWNGAHWRPWITRATWGSEDWAALEQDNNRPTTHVACSNRSIIHRPTHLGPYSPTSIFFWWAKLVRTGEIWAPQSLAICFYSHYYSTLSHVYFGPILFCHLTSKNYFSLRRVWLHSFMKKSSKFH